MIEAIEVLAGGCLSTTFTWLQHHGPVRALAATKNTALRDQLLPDAAAGRLRCGVAFAGVVPERSRMSCTRVDGGWSLTGEAPFVSGWGIVDQLLVSARDVETDDVLAGFVAAVEQPGVAAVHRQHLVAVDASNTVNLRLDGLVIPDERMASRVTRADFVANQNGPARVNGAIPLGLARRCARLLEAAGRDDEAGRIVVQVDEVRTRLDRGLADAAILVQARADGAELALHAAATLVAAGGGPSLLVTDHAQRLAREAVFTLVAASRPELKAVLVDRLSRSAPDPSSPDPDPGSRPSG